jgi:hypothetical protein
MPYAAGSVTLVANIPSVNQLSGNIEEFVTRPSWLRLSCIGSVAPLNCTFVVGRTVLINGQSILAVGATLSLKDHITTEHAALRGRILLTFVSTGVPVVLWRIDIVPMR